MIPIGQELHLSRIGQIIDKEINDLTNHFQHICLEKYVIMPNHIHLLVAINGNWRQQERQGLLQSPLQSPCPTISDIIGVLKSITTKKANSFDHTPNRKIWQFRFHDHIVRSDSDYKRIWQYIDSNPYKWSEDCYFSSD
jgi:REP element-mobilizing transposase RayT